MNTIDLSLCLITNRSLSHRSLLLGRKPEDIVVEAVNDGVTMILLREKDCTTRELYNVALRLKKVLEPYDVPLIIDDRVDIAIATDADGVHIGSNDIPYDVVRKLIGYNKTVGLTVDNLEQVEEANKYDIDYLAVAPIFYTPTIINATSAFGIQGLKKAVSITRHPIIAGGGINPFNVKDIYNTGVDGVAIASAIVSSNNPIATVRDIKKRMKRN